VCVCILRCMYRICMWQKKKKFEKIAEMRYVFSNFKMKENTHLYIHIHTHVYTYIHTYNTYITIIIIEIGICECGGEKKKKKHNIWYILPTIFNFQNNFL